MAGRLAIDFGNVYTVAAYWRQASHQAETLYLPGVTRPMPGWSLGKGKGVYAAPSLIAYDIETEACLVGQEVLESNHAGKVFRELQYAVVTGKRVNLSTGGRLVSNLLVAQDFLAAIVRRSGHVLGLGGEAAIAFSIPLAVCRSEPAWRSYRQWLEGVVSQAGFNRLELIEQPWAAAWGAGMKVKPEDIYIVVSIDAAYLEAAAVQVISQTGNSGNSRHIRVLSYGADWLTNEGNGESARSLTAISHQVVREAELLGYALADLAGVIVTGSAVQSDLLTALRRCFAGIAIYDREPLAAVACGAAVLSAGIDGCGYLRYSYTVRCLGEAGYHYREVVPQGTFYPQAGQIAELTIKASYDGQKEFAVLLYRGEDQCINEENPLLFTLEKTAVKGQPVIRIRARLDGAGQLLVTAYDLVNDTIIMNNIPAVKLV